MLTFFHGFPDSAFVQAIKEVVRRRSGHTVEVLPTALFPSGCTACGGTGQVLTPPWAHYFQEFPEKRQEPDFPEDWFLDQNYITVEQWTESSLPVAHQPCPNCKIKRPPISHG